MNLNGINIECGFVTSPTSKALPPKWMAFGHNTWELYSNNLCEFLGSVKACNADASQVRVEYDGIVDMVGSIEEGKDRVFRHFA